ncbi:MAG: cell envelope integrity protein CreD [Thermodesulfovibrionales bacterium]|nr:cell envelope integrity protein CreD [Thermodesulfovibrionales bacterium]
MNINSLKSSVSVRLMVIGFLMTVLMIPAVMVMMLISERESRRDSVVYEVSGKWGGVQHVTGPVLTVPFKKYYKDEKGNLKYSTHYAHLLPEKLEYNAVINPEIRYRGIFEVVLYNTDIHINGTFDLSALKEMNIQEKNVFWKKASLSSGISEMKGIRNTITLDWEGSPLSPDPGIRDNNALSSGITAMAAIEPGKTGYAFSMRLDLNGSGRLMFAPLGRVTHARMTSTWDTPSFTGEFLPNDREVSDKGFSADWKVLHLNRNFPQNWVDSRSNLDLLSNASFGAKLLMPVNTYQQTMRTAKYAIMFIALTFLAFFMIEVLNKKSMHPVQYLLVGFALVLFYTLLLSFSEHIAFGFAYLIACAATVAMIAGYTRSVLAGNRLAGLIAALLGLLYAFLYVILKQEDYALLIGSIGLFVILASVMYLTRRIDWYNALKGSGED